MRLRQLTGAALLGLRRADLALEKGELANAVLKGDGTEKDFLRLAGSLSLYEKMGALPAKLTGAEHEVTEEQLLKKRPVKKAVRAFATMLEGRHGDLLREYLLILKETGQSVPAEYLPMLLERAAKVIALRPYVLDVLTRADRELAEQNPHWMFASSRAYDWDMLLKQWRSKVMTSRQGILLQARLHDPDLGRELLASSWKAETSTGAIWMLRSLQTGLSMNDEPFLEMALDSRNVAVRRRAAELLSMLPASRLSERMTRATETLLSIENKTIKVNFPEVFSADMLRDGVAVRNWKDPVKVQAAQLSDLLASVPLEVWTARLNASPSDIVALAAASQQRQALLSGFASAAERQRAEDWAQEILAEDKLGLASIKLVSLLSTKNAYSLIKSLDEGIWTKSHPVLKLFGRYPHAWDEPLLDTFLNGLERYLASNPDASEKNVLMKTCLRNAAKLSPRESCSRYLKSIGQLLYRYPAWRSSFQDALMTSEFRSTMLAALYQPRH